MLVDVTNYPVIDNHCHPYPYSREKRPFWRCFNSTLFEQTEEMAKSTIVLHMVTNELREYMGMDPASSMDEVIAERDRRYHADPEAWVNALSWTNTTGRLRAISSARSCALSTCMIP